jgi:DNA (cytosine-5)-methyltransferase 1
VENTIVHNCQSFSQTGSRKGLNDSRGDLILKFADLLNLIQPKMFMIENVKGLMTHNKGETFKTIIGSLNQKDLYHIKYTVLNAFNYGVPQKRERIFIVGLLRKYGDVFEYPLSDQQLGIPSKLLKDVLVDVPQSKGSKYSEEKKKLFGMIPQGGCWVNLPIDIQKAYLGNSFLSGGGKRGILYRLSMDQPSLTLLCTPSQKQTERCHPLETRPLTILEFRHLMININLLDRSHHNTNKSEMRYLLN